MGKYPSSRWEKRYGIYSGPRAGAWSDLTGIDDVDVINIDEILGCMERSELLALEYSGLERVVAPFVFGVSSSGNPLLRAYQTDGKSKGGKGVGWRVFQVRNMSMVEGYLEYFEPSEFGFDELYPWIYKVLKML